VKIIAKNVAKNISVKINAEPQPWKKAGQQTIADWAKIGPIWSL
jgi:hypothetical protein